MSLQDLFYYSMIIDCVGGAIAILFLTCWLIARKLAKNKRRSVGRN